MSPRSLSALRTTRGVLAGALAFSLVLPLAAQEPTPAPTRIEKLATQTRILARLLERELGPAPEVDAWGTLYTSLLHAPRQGAPNALAARETKDDPPTSDAGRVVGEEPPTAEPDRALAYGDYRQAWLSTLAGRESSRKVKAMRSAAIPGSGAFLWIEIDLPASTRVRIAAEDPADSAKSAWEEARRDLEGDAAPTLAAPVSPSEIQIVADPKSEAAVVETIEKAVVAHAARLEALETGESITIVLTLRTPTALDQLLADRTQRSTVEMFLRTRTQGGAPGTAAGGNAPRVAEVVRVLRCPRVAPGASAPKQLETVTRYTQR
ncbi:MAG: hypothetical protein IPN34_14295 [Planctomycetes bacterium]|nr:hypothetical protein [Planctomycetota bacterium]